MGSESLGNLRVYQLSLKISELAWEVYRKLPKSLRYDQGSQFLRSVDSIGANIAEGYGRYHYKDKIKFYYNARGSLWEAKHWTLLLYRRKCISEEVYSVLLEKLDRAGRSLNAFIAQTGAPNGQ